MTEETKAGVWNEGYKPGAGSKAQRSWKGHKYSQETMEKIRAGVKRYWNEDDYMTIQKPWEEINFGDLKEEKMSKNKVGRKKGYKLSEASKAQISASKMGQHHSQETIEKIRAGVKRYWNEDKVGLSRRFVRKLTKDEIILALEKNFDSAFMAGYNYRKNEEEEV